MSQATAAYGIQLKLGATVVPELLTLGDVGGTMDTVEVTAHDGPGWKEFVATLLDAGVIRADFNFVPGNATQIALRTAMTARTLSAMSAVLPNGGPTWTFNAFVTQYRVGTVPVNGHLPLNVLLRPSGAMTFA